MFVRVTENDKGLAVMFCIPTPHGFAVTYTINKIKEVQMQEFKNNVSPTGRSILVCKKSNDKFMAIPFEVCIVDEPVFKKYKDTRITAENKGLFNMNESNGLYVFVHTDIIDYISEQYKDIVGIVDMRPNKTKKKNKEELVLSDEDWDLLNNKKEAKQ